MTVRRNLSVTRAHNQLVQRFRQARRDPSLVVLEGFHPIKHAVRFGAEVNSIVAAEPDSTVQLAEQLAPDVQATFAAQVQGVPHEVFRELSPHPPPTDVMALARRPRQSLAALLDDPAPRPVVYLERPRSLGNIGAAVRVAAAAGAAGVVATGPHDPWGPTALRGSTGLHFSLPVIWADAVPMTDRPVVAVHPDGEPPAGGRLPPRSVLAFGTERHGLTAGLLQEATMAVRIPMREGVSSLNLATAVAALLYGHMPDAG